MHNVPPLNDATRYASDLTEAAEVGDWQRKASKTNIAAILCQCLLLRS